MLAEARATRASGSPIWRLLLTFSWQEWRRHGVRHMAAMFAVTLGVALAFSVHLIHESALSEFDAAVRSVNGQADVSLHAARGGLDEALYPLLARHPGVRAVSPVIDVQTKVGGHPLRVLGLDPLAARLMTPALIPRVSRDVIGNERLTLFDPRVIFLNARAQAVLGVVPGSEIQVQAGLQAITLRVAGTVSAGGEALGVMDIAGAQSAFAMLGQVTRLDIQFKEGRQPEAVLGAMPALAGLLWDSPQVASSQALQLSRAYRVNLGVLALMALFTGSFLVFSTLSLSVAMRQKQFALLGVLGLSARERLRLVLLESSVLGVLGALLGLALGTGLAQLALSVSGGDLGGDYFAGSAPALLWSWRAAFWYGALGVLAAIWGGVLPARMAQRLAPAQALKGATLAERSGHAVWLGPALLVVGAALSCLPPLGGMPVWAYLAIACVMLGGIECVPGTVSVLLHAVIKGVPRASLMRCASLLLSLERVRHMRQSASVAIAGIVVSLGLSIALTVMVSSFRGSITSWLDTLLPADLYVRTGAANNSSDALHLVPTLLDAIAHQPGVAQVMGVRVGSLSLQAGKAPVALIARPFSVAGEDRRLALPLVGPALPVPAGHVGVYVSETMAELYGLRPGSPLRLPLQAGHEPVSVMVLGVWRDYAHQQGALIMHADDYQRLTGDKAVNDLALWLAPQAQASAVQEGIRQAAGAQGLDGTLLSFQSPRDIRQATLKVFDRSFAVAYWLQAVALGIGLFGVSASFSAQVLARRKEFGLLSHLGFTQAQIRRVLAGEGGVLTGVGALMGLALGLAVSCILVYVVNPQSFHWTMDLSLPWLRLAALCLGVVLAGTLTAWLAARAAVGADVVSAVKEDW